MEIYVEDQTVSGVVMDNSVERVQVSKSNP